MLTLLFLDYDWSTDNEDIIDSDFDDTVSDGAPAAFAHAPSQEDESDDEEVKVAKEKTVCLWLSLGL
jgi:hypothetical protein